MSCAEECKMLDAYLAEYKSIRDEIVSEIEYRQTLAAGMRFSVPIGSKRSTELSRSAGTFVRPETKS